MSHPYAYMVVYHDKIHTSIKVPEGFTIVERQELLHAHGFYIFDHYNYKGMRYDYSEHNYLVHVATKNQFDDE